MKLEITKDELENLKNNENAIRMNLISKAIYLESLEYKFTEEEAKDLWFLTENNILGLYMKNKVKPRIMVNEDSIAKAYKDNKEYFDTNSISFENARNIIIEKLTEEQNKVLFFDLVAKLINEMGETVNLSKKDILYTKGNPEIIKSILLISVLRENAKKDGFLTEFSKEIDLITKDTQLNFYLNIMINKELEINKEEVIDRMQLIQKENFEEIKSYSQEDLFQYVGNMLVNEKTIEIRNKIIDKIVEKYEIENKLKEYIK